MKKHFLVSSKITWSIYLFAYLCKTFVLWKLTNPFEWIIDLPTYDMNARAFILLSFISYQLMLHVAVYQTLNENKNQTT